MLAHAIIRPSVKTFLRRYNPRVAAAPRWRLMETLLRDSLLNLGHEVVEQEWAEDDDAPCDAGFTILPHATRRERPDADLFVKEMHLPGLFTVDVDGWGVEHSAIRRGIDFEGIDAGSAVPRVAALRERIVAGNLSRQPQPIAGEVPRPGYILLALQVPSDSVVVKHSPLSIAALLDAVSGWAEARRQRVAVKIHPCSLDLLDLVDAVEQRTRGSRYVFEVRGNIHSLIAASRGVFVINSSSGFEALVHGKPVATFGDCDYRPVTFAATPATIDEAAAWCDDYGPAEEARAAQFVDWYRSRHGYPLDGDLGATRDRLRNYLSAVVPR
jgi:diadenosine tetraphosphatase ApaH/serine/threonine PP2A family protein phosphatase